MQRSCFKILYIIAIVIFITDAATALTDEGRCARVVSLAPSITEVLFDLDLGKAVVGVTRFCRHPQAALAIQKIGGMYDLNIEQIVALRPTQVFALTEHAHAMEPLRRMGVEVLLLDHRGTPQILDSYRIVGRECGIVPQATVKVAELEREEREISLRCTKARGQRSPFRVMVVVGRSIEDSITSDIYVSGSDGFYSDILSLIAAQNVYPGKTIAVPTVSNEGLLKLSPDVIFEIVNVDDKAWPSSRREFWMGFKTIPAVIHNRVFILNDDFASIPGPRYILLARKLSDLLCGV